MEIIRKPAQSQHTNIIADIVFKFVPYWPLFLILFALAGAAAWWYIRITPPQYEVTARVMINDEKKGTEDSKTIESIDRLSSKKIIENEMEVFQSKTLLNEVVNRLHLYAAIYEENRFRKIRHYNMPFAIEAKFPEQIRATKKQAIQFNGNDVVINAVHYPLNEWINTPFGVLKVIPNKYAVASPDTKMFFELSPQKDVSADILKRLSVSSASKMSSIATLNLKDEIPDRGEDILNELVSAYNQAIVDDKNMLASNTLRFLDERLRGVEHELDSIERRIQVYRASRGAINIGEQGKLYLTNVSSNDQTLSDINMHIAVLDQVEKYVSTNDKSGGIIPSTLGVNDPVLSSLVEKLYSSELEYETLKRTTPENNPMVVSLQDRIDKLKPSIVDNIQSQRRSLQASRQNLSATNSSYSSTLRGLPEQERELVNINREQGIKSEVYTFLLQKREETALSSASTINDGRIIDQAEASRDPVSPKKKVAGLISLMAATLLGITIVLLKENLSTKVMFRHEIESLTAHPIIGEISAEPGKSPIVIGHGRRTFIAEQFRKLRASLGAIGLQEGKKSILVTSSIAGEGKSFVALNLAVTLSLSGKRVVLIDFDLNNPSLSKKLGISRTTGLSEWLENKADLAEIVSETDINKNLYFIAAGELPPNPAELIMNGNVPALMSQLSDHFDYIVIDSAPVSPVTDASLLSPYCDTTLYVIKHRYTPKIFVQRIDEMIRVNPDKNFGIVFNGVTARGFGNKNYGYGYGYGYITKSNGRFSKRLGDRKRDTAGNAG